MKKFQFLIFVLFFVQHFAHAQSYREDFFTHLKANDSTAQVEFLTKWEQEKPNDPELFVSYFIHYFIQGKKEVLSLYARVPKGEGLKLKDSSGAVGFLGSTMVYDRETIDKGIAYINKENC